MKSLNSYLLIASAILFLGVVTFGAIAVMSVHAVSEKARMIETEARNIAFIGRLQDQAHQLLLVKHHYLLDPQRHAFAQDRAVSILADLQADLSGYIAYEEAADYPESLEEVRLLRELDAVVRSLAPVTSPGEDALAEILPPHVLAQQLLQQGEQISHLLSEINALHFDIIARKIGMADARFSLLFQIFLALSILGLSLVWLGYVLHSRYIVAPVKSLARTARRLAAGDLSARADTHSRTEIGTHGPSRSFGLPLLLTLGQTAAGTVLANLGAMGTLSVTGGQNEIRRVLRTISLELATSRTSGPIEVVVAGDELFDTVEDLRHVDDPGAELAAAIAERDEGAIIDDRLPRLLVCHHDVVPPTLPDQGLDGLVGVITAAPEQVSRWQLEVTDTEHAQLRLPDGVQLKLVLPDLTPEVIADELDRLASPVADPDAPVPPDEAVGTDRADPVAAVADQSSNGQHPAGAIPAPASELLPSWLDVHLLGPVRVLRDGAPVEDLTPLTLQLLLYLVTHREGITAERLDEAIWAGQLAPPSSQRLRSGLTKLRETLGTGPDGQPLVPRRRTATCHVALSEHVGSDLDRAFAHLARARDLSSDAQFNEYAAALDLVRGEPFEGLPLSWASPVSERAIVELQNAALVAAAGYRQAGHLDQADQVIQQGLKLSDPCEPLYLEWARLEAARGRYGQVRQIRRQLRARYNDEADEVAGWVNTLSPETELVFKKLAQGE